jgi:hypothetical protein
VQAGQNFAPFLEDDPQGTGSQSLWTSKTQLPSGFLAKSATALASSGESPLRAFLRGGFLAPLPLVANSAI